MKIGLDAKWGISKFLQAREYRRAATHAQRFANVGMPLQITCIAFSHYYHHHHRPYRTKRSPRQGEREREFVSVLNLIFRIEANKRMHLCPISLCGTIRSKA